MDEFRTRARLRRIFPNPWLTKQQAETNAGFLLCITEPLFAKKVILHDCINRGDSVLPTNFFSLRICAAIVGDSYLINPGACPRDLGNKFGFYSEPVFLDCDTIQKFASKDLITALHVGKV
jgi:hypothetical protein